MQNIFRSMGRISAEQARSMIASSDSIQRDRTSTFIVRNGEAAELVALPQGDYQLRVAVTA